MVVWSHSAADVSVADTTYFGIALSRSAIGPVWSRHARARPRHVSRGSSSASAASARSSAPWRPASLMYGKSASAGGASMTPSSVACVWAVIEVMHTKTARGRATHRSARNRRPGGTSRRAEHARTPGTGRPERLLSQRHEQEAHRPPADHELLRRGGGGSRGRPPGAVASGRTATAGRQTPRRRHGFTATSSCPPDDQPQPVLLP